MRVSVLGAGVAGLVCALELAERGVDVEIIERGERLGAASCSWWAGGMLAPWCEQEMCGPLLARVCDSSIQWWAERVPQTARNGSLVVAQRRDGVELLQFARRTLNFRWAAADEIERLEPHLAECFDRALFFPSEAHLEPRAALQAIETRLGVLGVRVRYGADTPSRSFDRMVDCRGLAARDLLPGLRGVRGEMLVVRCSEVTLGRPIRLLHPRMPVYVVPRPDHCFMIGATMIERDDLGGVTARSMIELLSAACAVHPVFGEAEVIEMGAHVRPAFADNLPRVVRQGNRFFVNGLYRHGFLAAPALAQVLAEALLTDTDPEELTDEDRLQRRSA
jgi:glycine oxidase